MNRTAPKSQNWRNACKRRLVKQSRSPTLIKATREKNAADVAGEYGIKLEVVKLPTAKRGFVLLPRRWLVERSFGWMSRFRRLARDYERLPKTLAGLHYVAFVILMLKNVSEILV